MSVSTRLKRTTAGALGALVLFAGGGILLVPQVVSEEEARSAAVRSLLAVTGVQPQIGDVEFTMLPRPAIRLQQVRIEDGIRPAFTAQSLQATLRILPLLAGRVEIAALTFEAPRLSIHMGPGETFVFGLPLRSQAAESMPRPEMRFLDGTVLFTADDAEKTETISAVDGALAWSGANLTATGSFRWRTVPATMSLSIVNMAALERGDRSGVRLRFDSEPMRIGFDGGVLYLNGLQADGVLAADTSSLRDALNLIRAGPLTRGGLGPMKLKAQASLTLNSLSLTGLAIELDGNRAEGGLTLKRDRERTVLQATLASDTADFTPYSSGFAMVGPDGRDWSREPIDLSVLDAIDLDLRLSSGHVVVRNMEFGRMAAAAAIRNGVFTVSVGEADFYGGVLRGRAAFGRMNGAEPGVRIEANIADFNLETGLVALASIRRVEGKGVLALSLEGAGPHMQAIARRLSGSVTLTAGQGALNGINVEQVLRRLERKPLSGAPDFIGGRTAFDRLVAKLRIANGTAKVEEAEVESPLVRVKLAGEASVAHRDFDLKGTATLVRSAPSRGEPAEPFDLPFLVQGPWDRPFLLPDPTSLIRRSGAAAPLLDAMRRQVARERSGGEEEKEDSSGSTDTSSADSDARDADAR